MKKILIFSIAYFPFVGGAEVAVKEITDRINAGFDLITLRFDKKFPKFERIGNVNVYRIGFTKKDALNKILFPFLALPIALSLHKKEKYQCVWAIMAAYSGFAALFFKLMRPEVKYLLTLQEGDPIDYIKKKTRFVRPLFKKVFTKADKIQAISNYLACFASDMGYKGQVNVIPNAVDFARFSRDFSESEMEEVKRNLNIHDNEILLIHTGRIVLKNGISDIIKSLTYLPANIKFLSVGSGPDLEKLKNLSEELDVESRVIFHDFVFHAELVKFLKIANIFVRPSLSEGLGNSFLEAMAAGLPVIASASGGIPDFLFDPEINKDKAPTGLFCEVENPKSIAEKVKIYLDNSELKDEIKKNAKEMVEKEYSWDIVAGRMKKLFLYL
ncbi:MAG: glycosyltransferase family 4 protein [bacterium]